MRRKDLELVILSDGEVQRGLLLLCIIGEAERHFVVSEPRLVSILPSALELLSRIMLATSFFIGL
jgi:hypothetical protein